MMKQIIKYWMALSTSALLCLPLMTACAATQSKTIAESSAMKPLLQTRAENPLALPSTPSASLTAATLPQTISLRQAVLYGMAHNNALEVAEITHRINHSSLVEAQAQFEPQFSLAPTATITRSKYTGSPTTEQTSLTIGPAVSWKLSEGATVSANVGYNPNKTTGTPWQEDMSWNVQLSQPLLQGFGTAVTTAPLQQAKNSAAQAKITLHTTIDATLTKVIQSYYAVLSAQQALTQSQTELKNAKHQVFVKQQLFNYGRIPKMSLIQAQLDAETATQSVTEAQQSLAKAQEALLNTLNLPWNRKIAAQDTLHLEPFEMSPGHAMELALKNNSTYLNALISLKNDRITLLQAKNALRWQLNLTASMSQQIQDLATAASIGQGPSNTVSTNNSIGLNLNIPFGQTSEKAALESAELTDMQDKMKLKNLKNQMAGHIQRTLQDLKMDWQNISIAKEKAKLAKETDSANKVKLQYGKMTAYDYKQQHKQFLQAQQAVLKSKITYLQNVAQFQQYLGILLSSWHIHVKMPHWDLHA